MTRTMTLLATAGLALLAPATFVGAAAQATVTGPLSAPAASTGCAKAAKAAMTPEQKAQRKAMRAQRAAERAAKGLPPHQPGAHKAAC